MKEIPTPLTDAHDRMAKDCPPLIWVVSQAFARQLERDRHELIEALQSICNGDIGPDGQYHFTFSGSQCVKIATQILERMK